jgi:hypothetical protein
MTCRTFAWRCWAITAVLSVLLGLLGPGAERAYAKKAPEPRRFTFNIEPKTPLADLLPPAPDVIPPIAPWLVRELSEVPEILFARREAQIKRIALPVPKTAAEKRKANEARIDAEDKAMERTAHAIAKINHLNKEGRDHFLKVLRERRRDLDGLPFIVGDACRQDKEQARAFVQAVDAVHSAGVVAGRQKRSSDPAASSEPRSEAKAFWAGFAEYAVPVNPRIGALMQMRAMADEDMQQGLVEHLAVIKDVDATRALGRLALFSSHARVQAHARESLKARDPADYSDLLMAGLRYPWPAAAQNAGEAVIQLGLKDLVPRLVALLDEPDPRAPAEGDAGGKAGLVVREVVRLNHLRNCLLCHPPGNTPDVITSRGFPEGNVVVGGVPSPGVDLPSSPIGYGSGSPDILVRADTTYLRQDFSRMENVEDAAPWPAMQRFDFLVRTRIVTDKDAAAYKAWLRQQGPDYLAPHRQAALTALRALTGRDAAPTAQAWRAVLGQ